MIIDADISLSADTIVLHCDELEIFHAEIRLRCDSPLGMLNQGSFFFFVSINADQPTSDLQCLVYSIEPG